MLETDPRTARDTGPLSGRILNLQQAWLRISGTLDRGTLLQEVVDQACLLASARYGALLTFHDSGEVSDFVISGMSAEQASLIQGQPSGRGLLASLEDCPRPVRIRDIGGHSKSVGFPKHHPAMKSFLGAPIQLQGRRLANLYLADRLDSPEFTAEDEETIALFTAQVAVSLGNARKYEKALQAKGDLETLLNIAPVGVIVFEAGTGALIARNKEAERIVGDVGLPGNSWEDALQVLTFRRADGREISLSDLPLVRVLRSGETVRAEEIVIYLPDGRAVSTLVNAAPIYSEQGEVTSVVVVLQDMSPLEELDRMRTDFLSLVSNELRTPLTTIKGSLAALEDLVGPAGFGESRQLMRIIDLQTDLMRSQINSLIDLTSIENGTLAINSRAEHLNPLLEDARREFLRGNAGHRLEILVGESLPPVMMDRQRVAQVLQTLLSYGVKCSPPSSTLKITARREQVHVAITVSMDGQVVPVPELTEILQEPTRSVLKDMNGEEKGDRLALAICQGIVNAHGGRLWAHCGSVNQGMSLGFNLPVSEETDSGAEAPPDNAPDHYLVDGGKARILSVMANPRMLGAVQRALSHAGYSPIGSLELEELDRVIARERPHLVLLDMVKPRLPDYEIIRRVCQAYSLPVIVLSGPGDDDSVIRAFEMGADDYIAKPFSPPELVARIKASLRKRADHHQASRRDEYSIGDLAINYPERKVTVTGQKVHLTATEYQLLYELSRRAGRVLSQDELLRRIWGAEYMGDIQLLRAFVKTLRQKLGDDARRPTYIFTEHGVGYRMPKP